MAKTKVEEPVYLDRFGNKLCPTHKDRYLLLQPGQPGYTGLCAHPDCFGKQITNITKRANYFKRSVQMFKDLQVYEDFISYLYEQLLAEAQRGKPTVINGPWFKFKLQAFMTREMQKGLAIEGAIPAHYRKQDIVSVDSFDRDFIEQEWNEVRELSERGSAEWHTVSQEVWDFIEQYYGPQWCLFLHGEITITDLVKISKVPIHKVRRQEKALYRLLLDNFVAKEDKEELLKRFSVPDLDEMQKPLAQVLDKWGGATANALKPVHYETLADKINAKRGFPKRHLHYERLVNRKKKELRELEEKFSDTKEIHNGNTTQES